MTRANESMRDNESMDVLLAADMCFSLMMSMLVQYE